MFGSSKSTGQPPERVKADEPLREQYDDIPPMPEAAKPAGAPKKTFNFAEKPRQPPADDAAHLYIGANIRLKGEIASCDLMRVEGVYEGIARARLLALCPGGSFQGTAEVEDAEIEGSFEGALHVRGRLFLRKQGRIRGTFSYGELEIERGGEIDGRILPFDRKPAPAAVKTVEPPRPAPPPAPPAGASQSPSPAPQPTPVPAAKAAVTAPTRPTGPLNGTSPAPGSSG